MGPFLRGFVDELIKVAGPPAAIGQPPKPPTPAGGWGAVQRTATGTERAPTPSNYTAPTGAALNAIQPQRMESPGGTKPAPWRPSPGYRPKPASDPQPATQPKPQATQPKPQPGTARPAFENMSQFETRSNDEAQYNKNLAAGTVKSTYSPMPDTPKTVTDPRRSRANIGNKI